MVKDLLLTLILVLCFSLPLSSAQAPQGMDVVRVEAYPSHRRIHPGETFRVAIVTNIKQGFHINSHKPLDRFLMPTVVKFDEREEIVFGPLTYPEAKLKQFSFSTNEVSVYTGKISILAQGKLAEDISPGDIKVSGKLAYQVCDDQSLHPHR